MKISLITIFDVANFGTYLQTFATAVALQKFGASVEVVHYERPFKNTKLLRRNIILRGIYYLYFWLRGFDGILFTYRCRRFVSRGAKISKIYFSLDELKKNPYDQELMERGYFILSGASEEILQIAADGIGMFFKVEPAEEESAEPTETSE